MLTIKIVYPNAEQIFEVKSFIHYASENRIDGTDADGESFSIHLNPNYGSVAYAMNASGATVGKYHHLENLEE